jgi:cellulose synthase/poly-beta-1,6-N-acetylglucosamine synthase-like glycosyltransferase
MATTQRVSKRPTVSVIIPARNEETSLEQCLESLVAQRGVDFEIIVVDDHSTDRTREIAQSFPGVKLIEAGPLPDGWTGKNNAVATGARAARGEWLLFTDADTIHLPESLARSLHEAKRQGAALLSYSPQQIVKSFWEKAVMPVIFAELVSYYRPTEVSDPTSPTAAANGQFLLIAREAYDAVGGHAVIAGSLLEDVALAGAVKQSGRKIWFRYGPDAVRTRMYRNWPQLREGWTKNLALLFPSPALLATWRGTEFVLVIACLALVARAVVNQDYAHAILYAAIPVLTFTRIRRAHFPWDANILTLFGLPVFAYLLLRSRQTHAHQSISWKGRTYSGSASRDGSNLNQPGASSAGQASLLESHH